MTLRWQGRRVLRAWQAEAIERIRDAVRAGHRNILVVAPTGGGKTLLAVQLIGESFTKGKRAAFVVDRLSILGQTSEAFMAEGLEHGVIQSSHPMFAPYRNIQICSQQTLARRGWPESDLIIVDEAHTITETVRNRIGRRDVVSIGLTATPFTKGLGTLYDAVVAVTTTNALIRGDGGESPCLVPYRIFAAAEPDMEGVRIVAGEFERSETEKRALAVVGDVVAEYLKHGEGRKFICSAVDTAHVNELVRQFGEAGIACASYTYQDREQDRADSVAEFRKPNSILRGLVTVTAASKGFDVPDIGCVIMARPLRNSLAEHIQFFGRGLRACEGKQDCLVLDHSGNSLRFWDEWTEFFETGEVDLDDGKKRKKANKKRDDEETVVKCPECSLLHRPMPLCPSCGHAYAKRSTIQHKAGTLKELLASADPHRLRAELWPQVCWYVKHMRNARDDDHAQRMSQAIYAELTGSTARARYSTTTPQECSPEVAARIRGNQQRWAIARQRAMEKAA